jgi:hypothetical protein
VLRNETARRGWLGGTPKSLAPLAAFRGNGARRAPASKKARAVRNVDCNSGGVAVAYRPRSTRKEGYPPLVTRKGASTAATTATPSCCSWVGQEHRHAVGRRPVDRNCAAVRRQLVNVGTLVLPQPRRSRHSMRDNPREARRVSFSCKPGMAFAHCAPRRARLAAITRGQMPQDVKLGGMTDEK